MTLETKFALPGARLGRRPEAIFDFVVSDLFGSPFAAIEGFVGHPQVVVEVILGSQFDDRRHRENNHQSPGQIAKPGRPNRLYRRLCADFFFFLRRTLGAGGKSSSDKGCSPWGWHALHRGLLPEGSVPAVGAKLDPKYGGAGGGKAILVRARISKATNKQFRSRFLRA